MSNTWVWECRDCPATGHNYNENHVRREAYTHCLTEGHAVVGYERED